MTSPGSNRRVYKVIRDRILDEIYPRREGLPLLVSRELIRARVEELHYQEFAQNRLNVDDFVGALCARVGLVPLHQNRGTCSYCTGKAPESLPKPHGNNRFVEGNPENIANWDSYEGRLLPCCNDCFRRGGRWRAAMRQAGEVNAG